MMHYRPDEVFAYVYLLRFSENRYYVGVRYENITSGRSPLQDLGIFYFSSSKTVHALLKKEEPIFQILATFDTAAEASRAEGEFYRENSDIGIWLNRLDPSVAPSVAARQRLKYSKPSKLAEVKQAEIKRMLGTKEKWSDETRAAVSAKVKRSWAARTSEQREASLKRRRKTLAQRSEEEQQRIVAAQHAWRVRDPLRALDVDIKRIEASAAAARKRTAERRAELGFSLEKRYLRYLETSEDNITIEEYSKRFGNRGSSNPNYSRLFSNQHYFPLYYPSQVTAQGGDGVKRPIKIEELFERAKIDWTKYSDIEEPEYFDVAKKNFQIYSYNEDTKQPEFKKVKTLVIKPKLPYMYLVESSSGFFEAAPTHGILTPEGYKTVDELPSTFKTLSTNGEWLDTTKRRIEKSVPLLDLEVEDNANYFTGGMLSHNTTGGYAIKYYSSWRGRITRIDDIKDAGSMVGIVSRVRNTKNKIGIPKRDAELELRFATGFDSENEYLKFIVDLGIVEKRGAWFYQDDWEFKGNGRDSILAFLKKNPELFSSVKNTVNAMLSGETVIDVQRELREAEAEEGEEDSPEKVASEEML